MIHHRLEATYQTSDDAELQVASLEVWGRGAYKGGLLCVKAYPGNIPGVRGIEFATDLAPSKFSAPNKSLWYLNDTPGVVARAKDGEDYACICVEQVWNHQPKAAV